MCLLKSMLIELILYKLNKQATLTQDLVCAPVFKTRFGFGNVSAPSHCSFIKRKESQCLSNDQASGGGAAMLSANSCTSVSRRSGCSICGRWPASGMSSKRALGNDW